jgi:hypothetical protein
MTYYVALPMQGLEFDSPLALKINQQMKFIEHSHKYIDDEGIEYVPVTSLLKRQQEKVDWDAVAAKKAKKDGTTKEALLAQWADKRDRAADRGTAYHKIREQQVLASTEGIIVGYHTDSTGTKADSTMLLDNNTTYVEKMIWSKKYSVCGTADLVEVVDGRINVKDYKTNEKLDFESWKHPRTGPKRLLFPVQHLDDCNFNLYQLQVNLYMYMLLQQNRHLKMGKMEILHIIFNEDRSFKEERSYPALNMQREARNILDNQLKTR